MLSAPTYRSTGERYTATCSASKLMGTVVRLVALQTSNFITPAHQTPHPKSCYNHSRSVPNTAVPHSRTPQRAISRQTRTQLQSRDIFFVSFLSFSLYLKPLCSNCARERSSIHESGRELSGASAHSLARCTSVCVQNATCVARVGRTLQ